MFKIRSEQIRTFQPQAEAAFVERVAAYLKANCRDETIRLPQRETKVSDLQPDVLREMVAGGIARARRHGIEWKSGLLSFVVVMFVGAPNFDEHSKAERFLSDDAIRVEDRASLLIDEMTDEDWAQIAQNYDPQSWNL